MMPKGVEQRYLTMPVQFKANVKIPMMPKGVEQAKNKDNNKKNQGSEDSYDAERR